MPEPLSRTPRQLRDEVEQLVRDDLVGPLGGPEEELRDAPVDRYLLGLLAPRREPRAGSPARTDRPVSDGATSNGQGSPDAASGDAAATEDEEEEEDAQSAAFDALPEDELATGSETTDSGAEGKAEERPAAVDQLVPSAFGLTVALDGGCEALEVTAAWGAYAKETSGEQLDRDGRAARVWRRRACGGTVTVHVGRGGRIEPVTLDPDESEVWLEALVRERDGERLVSLFLVNGQEAVGGRSVEKWLCQAELSVAAPDGAAGFVRRPVDLAGLTPEVDRRELRGLELLYRDTVELSVGHGVATEAELSRDRPDRAVRVTTAALPAAEVPRTDAPGPADFTDAAIAEPFAAVGAALDMAALGDADDRVLPELLTPLVDAYEAWITAQEQRIGDPAARLVGHEEIAREHLENARFTARRVRAGISALAEPDVAEAFRFANRAMRQQRVHTIAGELRRRDPKLGLATAVAEADVTKNRSWRPFQLAFVLLNLPSLADPTHAERAAGSDGLVDLLFFPTGGGKTEAYLGLTAFTIAIRRLQGIVADHDGRDGVAVLMRYTLRLLTLQQFQRAAALLCACELERRRLYGRGQSEAERRWGQTPMRIGLWVGQASTPNTTDAAAAWVQQARQRDGSARGSSPLQLSRCPWCGSELSGGRDVVAESTLARTLLFCSDTSGQCAFTPRASPDEGLPVVVVDEEVYRLLPALVIATVDKLARMPWEGRAQALFGQVSRRCERHGYLTPSERKCDVSSHPARGGRPSATVVDCSALRPPDLIIQDELHLISGPLGSLVGLYETAVDELAGWTIGGQRVRPKVVASTATIRRAEDQVKRLFDRGLQIFPPPGLDARDSFFALQRDKPEEADRAPGRRYLGVCAPGRRYKQVLIRVYVAQLRAAWTVLGRQPGEAADAYMTLVGYFNSLRELGGMRRLVEDDVQSRLFRPGEENRGRLILEELTSRKSASEIPGVLDQLGVLRTSQAKRKPSRGRDGEAPAIDVLLATNMISVGVDVPRLGTMVVAGQPKSTSEYIQATSRVGRQFPGLVFAVYNWARPRDLSHYETFGHYHRTLYRQVEALSVTPFAPRAVDRGLTGVLASLLRLCGEEYNANGGAALVDPAGEQAQRARKAIFDRADDQLKHDDALALDERVEKLLHAWKAAADVGQRDLVYQARGRSQADVSLLEEPEIEGWKLFTVPTSMRNVEAAVPLMLRPAGISVPAESWEAPEKSAAIPPPENA